MTSRINSNSLDFIVINALTGKQICENDSCKLSKDFAAEAIEKTFEEISRFFVTTFPELQEKLKGKKIQITIHTPKVNAAFIPSRSTGNDRCFEFNDSYMQAVFAAHEYTHAVEHSYVDLEQKGESGALSESIADVFAIVYQQWSSKNCSSWNLGAIRDLSEMKHLRDKLGDKEFPCKQNDFGYIHENSKIPSHAFYLAVTQSKEKSSEVIAQIWFEAMKQMRSDENFVTFATKTLRIAESQSKLLGGKVKKAWESVGVLSPLPKKQNAEKSAAKKKIKSLLNQKKEAGQVYPASPNSIDTLLKSEQKELQDSRDRNEQENLISLGLNSSLTEEEEESCLCPCTIL